MKISISSLSWYLWLVSNEKTMIIAHANLFQKEHYIYRDREYIGLNDDLEESISILTKRSFAKLSLFGYL